MLYYFSYFYVGNRITLFNKSETDKLKAARSKPYSFDKSLYHVSNLQKHMRALLVFEVFLYTYSSVRTVQIQTLYFVTSVTDKNITSPNL